MFQGQDWEPVIIKKPKPPTPQLQVSQEKKYTKQLENEEARLNSLGSEMRKSMISYRNEKKLTQDQLAKKINEQTSVIRDLESGKIVNTQGVIQKINKVLGTRLKFI
jgi:putative transcription factor